MEKSKLLYYIAFVMLLCGCSREDSGQTGGEPINPDGSIAFLTDILTTKGTPQDNIKAYGKVDMLVYRHNGTYVDGKSLHRKVVLNKDGSTPPNWEYDPPMFWPAEGGLSFLGYTVETTMQYATASGQPGVFISPNGDLPPTIEYIVPTDVTKHPDLLVTAQLNEPKAQNITLAMKHALSCVSFCATAPKGVTTMKVKSIKLNKIFTRGTFVLDDPLIGWKLDPTSKTDQTFREPGIDPNKPLLEDPSANYNYLMTPDGYLMMLPQVLKDVTIDVVYILDGEEKPTTYTLPSDIVWEPGKKYIYRFGEDLEEVVVYYEKYADGTFGFQNDKFIELNPLDDAKEIMEAGYGVLTKSTLVSKTPTLKIEGGSEIAAAKTAVPGGYNLYAISQTGSTFALPATKTPVAVYFDGNVVPCGKITPHFAKGVSFYSPSDNTYYIRTPQQMQNISALTTTGEFNASQATYNQERDLDFSQTKSAIGGGALNGAVVDQNFSGIYDGKSMAISNVTINAGGSDEIGLFSVSHGKHIDMMLKSSSITGKDMVGGIVGRLYGGAAAIDRARVIGTNSTAERVAITGVSKVGGIVGDNGAPITGYNTIDDATEITVATLSGWVNITGSGDKVGGVVGYNSYGGAVKQVLVNGVYVTGTTLGALQQSEIVIKGANYVGGIAGQNDVEIIGNVVGTGADIKNMPDVAGIVKISGASRIGGIAGANASNGHLNSVNIRLGRSPAMTITGTDVNVGGIVGENSGNIGVESTNTFISTRGNIEITGAANVGGIVGLNSGSGELKNCFVYDFYSQGSGAKTYYAPKIKSIRNNAGGIVGLNSSSISNSSVFSANKNILLSVLSDGANAGGLVGSNISGGSTTACSVVGNIAVKASNSAGGVAGDNKFGTTISNCWIGSLDGNKVIESAQNTLGLVITAPGATASFGTPNVTGDIYIGGIVGLNDGGIIDGVTLKDNIIIGSKDASNWVGGIAGGNTASFQGETSIIKNCKVENTATTTVTILGSRNLGGIVGLNNGMVDICSISGVSDNYLKIIGLGTIGGIVGQHGGHSELVATPPHSGNEYTTIKNCTVTGFVTLQGSTLGNMNPDAKEVGGIAGITGANTDDVISVDNCSVGKSGTVNISVDGSSGGIVGTNAARIRKCDVYNANISSTTHPSQGVPMPYAGGIAGITITNSTTFIPPLGKYCSDINDCRVYSATIKSFAWGAFLDAYAGALVGNLNSDIAFAFGKTTANQVNNTSVIVNNNNRPSNNSWIVGLAAGNGSGQFATINHTVAPLSPR